jgi:hypothetical protein
MKCFGDVVTVSKIDIVYKVENFGVQAYVVNGMSSWDVLPGRATQKIKIKIFLNYF